MYYNSVAEYYEAEKENKYNYGDAWLPKFNESKKHKKRSSVIRRGVKIHAYVGQNGSGKSLAMIHDTLPTLNGIKWKCDNPEHYHFKAHGETEGYRRVLSTVRLVDPRTGEDHPLWIPYRDHRQLLTIEHADVLMDEITGVASAYEAMSMPTQVNNVLMQLRRRGVVLRWTTPNWAAAAKRIREVTKAVTWCKGSLPIYEEGSTWGSNTKFFWKTYDAGNFESFNVGVRDRILPETWEHYFRPFKHNQAQEAYDTLAEVLAIGATSNNGMCVHCGGKRNAPRCTCDPAEVDTEENYQRVYGEMLEEHRLHIHTQATEAEEAAASASVPSYVAHPVPPLPSHYNA